MIDYFYVKYHYDIVIFVYVDMCKKSEASGRIKRLCVNDEECKQQYPNYHGCTCKQYLCHCDPPKSTNIANNLLAPELRT